MRRYRIAARAAAVAAALSSALAGCALQPSRSPLAPPTYLRSTIIHNRYDGVGDDLLTAGLGRSGLANPTAPGFADRLRPTPAELRRLAIYNNYRALVDMTAGGGYGVLYGPGVAMPQGGREHDPQGRIAGDEYLAYAADPGGAGDEVITLMVQIPASYDLANGCIITAPSPGSRGIYGAIATAGEWGLKHGCAVAYTDKGTGIGAHDLQRNRAYRIDGVLVDAEGRADAGGRAADFTANLTREQRAAFNAATPNRFAFKHAHSQTNPERSWGDDVLNAIDFAFYVLNLRFGGSDRAQAANRDNTLVIASGVSNGGGASLRAAEQDRGGLINGVVVSEPNVQPLPDPSFVIVQGNRPPLVEHGRPLLDYITLINVYQACASLDPALAGQAPLNNAGSAARCASLHERGLLREPALELQAAEAQRIINAYGILPEQNLLQPSMHFLYVPQSIAVTHANAYGRQSVAQNLCGYSFAAIDGTGAAAPLAPAEEAALFATGNGIPPTGGVYLINNLAPGGAREDRASTPDQNLEGALCLRRLATGIDPATGEPLAGDRRSFAELIRAGIAAVLASGNPGGKPAIIVDGRSDAVLPPDHTSRAYYGHNQSLYGASSRLRYYEVTNAQHLDTLNALPGFAERYIPLNYYYFQALDLMYNHLRHGTPLPPSQVVQTVPRGGAGASVPPISTRNLPPIAANPAPSAQITFANRTLTIPE